MQSRTRFGLLAWLAPLMLIAGACSSSDSGATNTIEPPAPGLDGESCDGGDDCVSGVCQAGECVGNGEGAPWGEPCSSGDVCASGICDEEGACEMGSGLEDGQSCVSLSECESLACTQGVCGTDGPQTGSGGSGGGGSGSGGSSSGGGGSGSGATGNGGGGGLLPAGSACDSGTQCQTGVCVSGTCSTITGTVPTTTTVGPQWGGTGLGYRPLTTGCPPDTADYCTGTCEQSGGDPDVDVVRPPATLCFAGDGDLTPEDPSVVIEQVIESVNGQEYVHIRVTFDPSFTDNTYGTGSCCGWNPNRPHTITDLLKSDHTELLLTNGDVETVMNFKIDLATAGADADACGTYGTLGAEGGDGAMILGDPAHILAVATSLDRNVGGCGYCDLAACDGDCSQNSPMTDEAYTPNPEAPDWDYRQVYEVWLDMAAFGDSGFGQAYITYTHSSPAKGNDTIIVTPTPCPPDWDTPYCPPGVPECFTGSGGSGGTGGSGGEAGSAGTPGGGGTSSGGTAGSSGTCPPNYQLYIASEGAQICTPIPFANWPGMEACPAGYQLDIASEGRYCTPIP